MDAAAEVDRRIRALLGELSPRARMSLVRRLKGARHAGAEDPTHALILSAAASLDEGSAAAPPLAAEHVGPGVSAPPLPRDPLFGPAPSPDGNTAEAVWSRLRGPKPEELAVRAAWAERLRDAVLAAAEPCLVDDHGGEIPPGRIARSALGPAWEFLSADAAARSWQRAVEAGPTPEGAVPPDLVQRLRIELGAWTIRALDDLARLPRGSERLAFRLGGTTGFESLRAITYLLSRDAEFRALLARLPGRIDRADLADGSPLLAAMARALRDLDGLAVGVVLLPRLAAPRLLLDAAVRLAGASAGRLVASAPAAGFVETIFGEIDLATSRAARHAALPAMRHRVPADLWAFNDLVHAVATAIDLDSAPEWSKRIARARRAMSEVVAAQIEPLPGEMRRLLRGDVRGPSGERRIDATALADVSASAAIFMGARAAADSLAVNDLLARLRRTLEPALEASVERSLDDLRRAEPTDSDFRAAVVEAVVRLSRILFGESFAETLCRRRDAVAARPAVAPAA